MKKIKRTRKILSLLIAMMVLAGTMLIANADGCIHGGEKSTMVTYKTVVIDCVSAGTHQCYVAGELTSCAMYCYKMINYQHCALCNAEGQSYYSYGPIQHQYNH